MVSIIKTGRDHNLDHRRFPFFAVMPKKTHGSIIHCSKTSPPPLSCVRGSLFISVAERQPVFSNPQGWPGFAKPGEMKQPQLISARDPINAGCPGSPRSREATSTEGAGRTASVDQMEEFHLVETMIESESQPMNFFKSNKTAKE